MIFLRRLLIKLKKTLQPYVKFNKLMTKNVEVLTELQLNAIRTYSEMGIEQMKSVGEIRDVTSLAAYNSQQMAVLTKLSQQW